LLTSKWAFNQDLIDQVNLTSIGKVLVLHRLKYSVSLVAETAGGTKTTALGSQKGAFGSKRMPSAVFSPLGN
jgi:hypothetical protein